METFISMKMICRFNKSKNERLKFGETETMCKYKVEIPINKPLEQGIEYFLVKDMMKQVEEDPTREVNDLDVDSIGILSIQVDTNVDSIGIFLRGEKNETNENV